MRVGGTLVRAVFFTGGVLELAQPGEKKTTAENDNLGFCPLQFGSHCPCLARGRQLSLVTVERALGAHFGPPATSQEGGYLLPHSNGIMEVRNGRPRGNGSQSRNFGGNPLREYAARTRSQTQGHQLHQHTPRPVHILRAGTGKHMRVGAREDTRTRVRWEDYFSAKDAEDLILSTPCILSRVPGRSHRQDRTDHWGVGGWQWGGDGDRPQESSPFDDEGKAWRKRRSHPVLSLAEREGRWQMQRCQASEAARPSLRARRSLERRLHWGRSAATCPVCGCFIFRYRCRGSYHNHGLHRCSRKARGHRQERSLGRVGREVSGGFKPTRR